MPKRHEDDGSQTYSFRVAGLNYSGNGEYWLGSSQEAIDVVREPWNEYDRKAIALHIFGCHAGYVPRQLAKKIAPLLDLGYQAHVSKIFAKECVSKREEIDDSDNVFYIADASITLYPPEKSADAISPEIESLTLNSFTNEAALMRLTQRFQQKKEYEEKQGDGEVDIVLNRLDKLSLPYVDKREQGGSLWVFGDETLAPLMDELSEAGITFRYKPEGGKATKGKSAWWGK